MFRLSPDQTERRIDPADPSTVDASSPVVLVVPARNEEPTVSAVVQRTPARIGMHPVEVIVIDDGSTDATAALAHAVGATVISTSGLGLGAAVRLGLAAGVDRGAAAIAFCDADEEYAPEELERLVTPILSGAADYVVGSRFTGNIEHMHAHRRVGNVLLTVITRWIARTPISDAQSGYRALSHRAAAASAIEHDFNYAQVLTLDLIGKGFGYTEVPISYRFRSTGRSYIRLIPYLRAVIPAVRRVVRRTNAAPRSVLDHVVVELGSQHRPAVAVRPS